eukprot:m.46330 g.46330  ORF g.46330 m.46330 type:complete len:64 (-) comp8741_c1_seq1:1272-1463(-)
MCRLFVSVEKVLARCMLSVRRWFGSVWRVCNGRLFTLDRLPWSLDQGVSQAAAVPLPLQQGRA